MKQTNIVVVSLILIIALTIYFSYKWTNHDKVELDASTILKVTMCYVSPFCDSTILLTRQQTEDFVKKWNNGTSLGYNKYQCQYYVEVYLTNNKKRTFCTSQDEILEGSTNGWVFSLGDKNYFDSLYQINKATLRKHEVDNYK
jgi:hypothetical protein